MREANPNQENIENLKKEFFAKNESLLKLTEEVDILRQKLKDAGVRIDEQSIPESKSSDFQEKKAIIEKRRQQALSLVKLEKIPIFWDPGGVKVWKADEIPNEIWSRLENYLVNEAPDRIGDRNATIEIANKIYNQSINIDRNLIKDIHQEREIRTNDGERWAWSELMGEAIQWFIHEKKTNGITASLKEFLESPYKVVNDQFDAELKALEK